MYRILVWYIKKWRLTEEVGRQMADSNDWWGGGWQTVTIGSTIFVPGSNPHPDPFLCANFHVTQYCHPLRSPFNQELEADVSSLIHRRSH